MICDGHFLEDNTITCDFCGEYHCPCDYEESKKDFPLKAHKQFDVCWTCAFDKWHQKLSVQKAMRVKQRNTQIIKTAAGKLAG